MLEQALKQYFGHDYFRTGQKEVIQSVLANQDTLAIMPTGNGKSLCYQLPGYLLDGLVIIVSPLLSLMEDQVYGLQKNGEKRGIAFNSQLSFEEREYVLAHLSKYKFFFISPEMLVQPTILQALKKVKIALFVVDEAHCVSQWGIDFRPEYLQLATVKQSLGEPTTLALTATATEQVAQDIQRNILETRSQVLRYPMDRPNIGLIVADHFEDKDEHLAYYLGQLSGAGIIYCATRNKVEELYQKLRNRFSVGYYHGGLASDQRKILQQQFSRNELQLLIATNAFGMGINKQDIRFVIHYDLPDSLENYSQEIGRAGRDGKQSYAILLYQSGDESIHYFFQKELSTEREQLEKTTQSFMLSPLQEKWQTKINELGAEKWFTILKQNEWEKQQQLKTMLDYIHWDDCRRSFLLAHFGEEKQVVQQCCDKDGLEITLAPQSFTHQTKSPWQERLLKIFKETN
jgi:ATP-dependent DNA helicase RecQ